MPDAPSTRGRLLKKSVRLLTWLTHYFIDPFLKVSDTFRIVKFQAISVCFVALTISAGCGAPSATFSGNSPVVLDLTGNWQIDSTSIQTTNPPSAVILLGALQSAGSQVSGTFRFTNLAQPSTCGFDQVVAFTGTIDSNNNLTLTSSTLPNGTTIKALLGISAAKPYAGTGSIEVDGANCTFASAPAIGEEIANATGTYAGVLSPGTIAAPGTGTLGTGTVTLTQSTNPEADGRFTATASLNYQFDSCSSSVALTGFVSGVGVIMSSTNGSLTSPQYVGLIGTINPAANKVTASLLSFLPAPCSADLTSNASYNGELNRQ
jgi:hypothetical protein